MTKLKTLGISLAVATALSFSGCGKSDTNKKIDPITSTTYQGSGSNWKGVFKSNGEILLTESDNNLSIGGTYKALDSGYIQITVASTNINLLSIGSTLDGILLKNNSR